VKLRYRHGLALAGTKDYDKAVAEIKKAIELEPGNSEIRKALQDIRTEQREHDGTSFLDFRGKLSENEDPPTDDRLRASTDSQPPVQTNPQHTSSPPAEKSSSSAKPWSNWVKVALLGASAIAAGYLLAQKYMKRPLPF
jgi:hypothetical protein